MLLLGIDIFTEKLCFLDFYTGNARGGTPECPETAHDLRR